MRHGSLGTARTAICGLRDRRLGRTQDRLDAEVAEILRQAAEADQREDLEHGQARADELPEALASKTSRLARLRQAKAQLEAKATERTRRFAQRAAASAAAAAAKGKPPPTLNPERGTTANVTDPHSRLLHTRKGRVQGYNAHYPDVVVMRRRNRWAPCCSLSWPNTGSTVSLRLA